MEPVKHQSHTGGIGASFAEGARMLSLLTALGATILLTTRELRQAQMAMAGGALTFSAIVYSISSNALKRKPMSKELVDTKANLKLAKQVNKITSDAKEKVVADQGLRDGLRDAVVKTLVCDKTLEQLVQAAAKNVDEVRKAAIVEVEERKRARLEEAEKRATAQANFEKELSSPNSKLGQLLPKPATGEKATEWLQTKWQDGSILELMGQYGIGQERVRHLYENKRTEEQKVLSEFINWSLSNLHELLEIAPASLVLSPVQRKQFGLQLKDIDRSSRHIQFVDRIEGDDKVVWKNNTTLSMTWLGQVIKLYVPAQEGYPQGVKGRTEAFDCQLRFDYALLPDILYGMLTLVPKFDVTIQKLGSDNKATTVLEDIRDWNVTLALRPEVEKLNPQNNIAN